MRWSVQPGVAANSPGVAANSLADAWDRIPLRYGDVVDRSALTTARRDAMPEARAHSNTYRPVGFIKSAYQQLGMRGFGSKQGKVDVAGSRHLLESRVTAAGFQHQLYPQLFYCNQIFHLDLFHRHNKTILYIFHNLLCWSLI